MSFRGIFFPATAVIIALSPNLERESKSSSTFDPIIKFPSNARSDWLKQRADYDWSKV